MIHASAIVHPNAKLCAGVEIGPYCVVGEHVSIGKGSILHAHVVINGWTEVDEECLFYPFATIGAASQDKKYHGERAFTKIGKRTIVREYVSIQRATGEEEVTCVGDDCLLLAYVHVAHNCIVGNGVTMSNLVQLAGHVEVGNYATIGGMAGIHQFVRIGAHAMIGGASKVTKDVPPYFLVEGNPAQPYGVNSIGLRRAEFSIEERNEIKRCYKVLYAPQKNISQAIDQMKAEVVTARGLEIIAFLESSQRGVIK